ncbi:tetratricopeptide repeat protein [Bradyrhizobium sp. CSS354]|nr:tetratricopeptide repeat protein [Bradyrhizobium sp. CSS354]
MRQPQAGQQLRSIGAGSCSRLLAVLAVLLVGGCTSLNKSAIGVAEAPGPELSATKDVDPAVRARVVHAFHQDAGEDTLRAALSQRPGNVDVAIPLARALLARKHADEALQILDSVLIATPGDLRALNAKAVVLDTEGRHSEAQALYQRALAMEPDNEMLRNNLNLSLALNGKAGSGNASLLAPSDEAHPQIDWK